MKELVLPSAANDTVWAAVGSLWGLLLVYLLAVNLVAFLMMWSDKRRAKRTGARRISEKALFLSALLGGSVGAILGMQLFRHKTTHWYFVWGMPAILVLQLGVGLWLYIVLR